MPNQIFNDKDQGDRIEKKVDRCLSLLLGDSEPDKGLIVKVDRLVQQQANREKQEANNRKYAQTAAGAAISAIVAALATGAVAVGKLILKGGG